MNGKYFHKDLLICLLFARFSFIHPPQCIWMHVCLTSWLHLFKHLFIYLCFGYLSFILFWTISGKDEKWKVNITLESGSQKHYTHTQIACEWADYISHLLGSGILTKSDREIASCKVSSQVPVSGASFWLKNEKQEDYFWRLKVQSAFVFVVNPLLS